MSLRNHRRDFLKTTAAVGAGYWVASRSAAAVGRSPNDQINFACIGVDGKGESDSNDAGSNGNVVAICDVDDTKLEKGAGKFPKAKKFNDFRKMLEEMKDSIDAVTVSTPDHCHAVAAGMAMKLGKHCFCQKPMTRTIWEARRLGEIAREMKVATQMGNQGTADRTLRHAAAVVRAGTLGNVKEVHVWTNRPIWKYDDTRPAEKEVPANLHWDLWLGPAPARPYADGYHPFSWRGYWDFGTGALGDMACHTVNMAYQGLDLRNPVSVEAQFPQRAPELSKETFPKSSTIKYEFPANSWRQGLTMVWYDGGKLPAKELFDGENVSETGCLIIGDKGKLFAPGDYAEKGHRLLGGVNEPKVEDLKIRPSMNHFVEWVQAIRGGEPAMSNFPDYAGPLTETILLGNLAIWAGKKVEWDAKNMVAKNSPECEPLVRPKYREGYTL